MRVGVMGYGFRGPGMERFMDTQAKFEGWAVVELFGHSREVGYVTTEHFGSTSMFRIDVPGLPEREYKLEQPQWEGMQLLPAGTVVRREEVQGRTRLVGVGAVYGINPCTEDVAMRQIERTMARAISVVSVPAQRALPETAASVAGEDEEGADDCYGGEFSVSEEESSGYQPAE